jgi:hypothetical protein
VDVTCLKSMWFAKSGDNHTDRPIGNFTSLKPDNVRSEWPRLLPAG